MISNEETSADRYIKTILLVDDDERFIDMFVRFLSKEKLYNIVASSNAGNIVDLARKHKPDLILLDVLMPGRGGEELINDFRNDDIVSSIPVLFITGLLDVSECDNAIKKVGSCYFMAKNTPSNVLLRLIREKIFGPEFSYRMA